MPELPEVEILVRHLRPRITGKRVQTVEISRPRVCAPTSRVQLKKAILGAEFADLQRRGKYLIFTLHPQKRPGTFQLLGHLGMTGRMYVQPEAAVLPKHRNAVLNLDKGVFIFEDPRYFGRFTLDLTPLARLGPEPLSDNFSPEYFQEMLKRSIQPIKPKLLDQSLVAGVGNIYASEALFRAGISPTISARKLSSSQAIRLWNSIREVLVQAIQTGGSLDLGFSDSARGGLFYFGNQPAAETTASDRFIVYDRAGEPCVACNRPIRRLFQAGRSTFFCPDCQRNRGKTTRKNRKSN